MREHWCFCSSPIIPPLLFFSELLKNPEQHTTLNEVYSGHVWARRSLFLLPIVWIWNQMVSCLAFKTKYTPSNLIQNLCFLNICTHHNMHKMASLIWHINQPQRAVVLVCCYLQQREGGREGERVAACHGILRLIRLS